MADYDSSFFINAAAEARERARLAQQVADARELTALRDRAGRGDVDAYHPLVVAVARAYDKRVHWVHTNPHAVRPLDAYLRFPEDDEKLAEDGHEIGHLLCEPCEGLLHVPFDADGVRTCLRCEVAAWEKALELFPFSAVAFQRLQRALTSYRATPAPPAVRQQADRLVSASTLTDHQRRRQNLAWRRALQQRVEREVAAETLAAQKRWSALYE